MTCGNPGTISNGRVIGSNYAYGSQVTYVCNNNYNLTGGSITQSCTGYGYWRGRKPSCLCMYIIKQCLYRKRIGIEYSVIRPINYRSHILRKEKGLTLKYVTVIHIWNKIAHDMYYYKNVSGIILIRYAQNRNIGKSTNLIFWEQ